VYLEAVSVLPQLRMMQNAKVVEKFTAHYVFALGLSRFVSCAHWVLQVGWDMWLRETDVRCIMSDALPPLLAVVHPALQAADTAHAGSLGVPTPAQVVCCLPQIIDGDSFLLQAIGSGLWPAMVLLSEIVQTFILADFW
jgi:ER lumen protein retaining receptor